MTAFRFLGLALSLMMLTVPALSQTTVQVHPDSEFWIEGRSSVNAFTCQVDSVAGHGQLGTNVQSASLSDAASGSVNPGASLQVPVRTFDCGKRVMTNDLHETLQAKKHPMIRYQLQDAEIVRTDSTTTGHRIRARGTLTIAGTERAIELVARGRRIGPNQYRLCGSRTLKMSDFGIEPPTKFFGLIRVKDSIEVNFDLIATSETSSSAPALAAQDSLIDSSTRLCSL
jgi:hypothetical protein